MSDMSRRDAVRMAIGIGAGALGTGLLMRSSGQEASTAPEVPAGYAHGVEPPAALGPRALDPLTWLPPARRHRGPIDLWVSEQPVEIARGASVTAWTFNGSIPGPTLRAAEGERLVIRMRNLGSHPHNLHFHGRHDIAEDGREPVPPRGEATYHVTAEPFGLHPYHCDATPAAEHLARGLYGLVVVDPPGGRRPAHEVALVLSGFDVDGDGHNELYGWNGVAGFYERYPIKVPVGELVRVYLLNMVADDPLASFHLHAETFDVFRSGTRLVADERTDVVSLAQTERAIVEFTLPRRGRYMFHPHQRQMAERGAMGWFAAI